MAVIFERLKKETNTSHVDLERILVSNIKAIKTEEVYAQLISLFYGYYEPLEQQLNKFINASLLPDWSLRRKAANLYNDLLMLNYTGEIFFAEVPEIFSLSEAVGCMYVLEGSTLGGKIITTILKKILPDAKGCYCFFDSYGDSTNDMWQQFKQQIEQREDSLVISEVISGAQNTFEGLNTWFKKNSRIEYVANT